MKTQILLILSILAMNFGFAQGNKSETIKLKSTPKSVSRNEKLAPGKPITNFEFKDMNGNIYTLASLKGKVVVLNFWFSTCVPCIEEVPELNMLVEKYKDMNVVFLSPTFENEETAMKFIVKHKLMTNVSPNNKAYTDEMGFIYYPANIILDKDGYIFKTFSGSVPDFGKVFTNELDFLLKM